MSISVIIFEHFFFTRTILLNQCFCCMLIFIRVIRKESFCNILCWFIRCNKNWFFESNLLFKQVFTCFVCIHFKKKWICEDIWTRALKSATAVITREDSHKWIAEVMSYNSSGLHQVFWFFFFLEIWNDQ